MFVVLVALNKLVDFQGNKFAFKYGAYTFGAF